MATPSAATMVTAVTNLNSVILYGLFIVFLLSPSGGHDRSNRQQTQNSPANAVTITAIIK